MSKLNNRGNRPVVTSPVRTTGERAVTAMGGNGYLRDEKSELYLLAITNMVSEKTFHEAASDRDSRYNELIWSIAHTDGAWIKDMVTWLRTGARMRTASIVMAAQAAHARTSHGLTEHVEDIILGALKRADEPGEFIAYWFNNFSEERPGGTRSKSLPQAVRRAVGKAAMELYTEYAWLKYDSSKRGVRFADVLRLTHPNPGDDYRRTLHQAFLDDYRGRKADMEGLETLKTNRKWRKKLAKGAKKDDYTKLLDAQFIRDAGLTWEDALSALGSKVDKKLLWEAVIPSMGYMALLRNLRNFDEANISEAAAVKVVEALTDKGKAERSGILPMQVHAAYRESRSLRWSYPLEQTLGLSLANVPQVKGRTLILVDTSSSMNESFSKDGSVKRWDAAVLFGLSLAQACEEVDVVSFSSTQKYWGDAPGANTKAFVTLPGESVLRGIDRWNAEGFFLGGGTDTVGAVRKHLGAHDRVVIITDEQAGVSPQSVSDAVPKNVPLFTWNLAGYRVAHGESGTRNRFTSGGLTDAAFRQIALMEDRAKGAWPWETGK